MKKLLFLLISLLPIIIVNAEGISCYPTSSENLMVLENTENFPCSGIVGDKLTFKNNETDLSNHFEYTITDGNAKIILKDKNDLVFNSDLKYGIVIVSDGKTSTTLYIKNNAYVKPSHSTTTTEIKDEITYTVVLDNNGEKEEKKCNVKKEGETCYINLPKIESEGFNGWGTSNSCEEGNIGNAKINQNKIFYACYENKQSEEKNIYLKSLKIFNNNNEEIKFGTFSIKKFEYDFKVLNEVESIVVQATAEDNITIEYIGAENLVVGENEIIIKISDEFNNTNEYLLKVNRLKEGEKITNINYLSALVVGNYKLDFNKEVFNYNLTIDKDISKLVINAVPQNETNNIKIKNNNQLENGSIIEIDVIDDEKNVTTYKINIIKESNNLLLYIAIGLIVILIIILIILIIIKNNQKKKIVKNNLNNNDDNVEVLSI